MRGRRNSGRRLLLAGLMLGFVVAACGGGSLPLGLTRAKELHIPNDVVGTPHSTEMVVDNPAGLVYIADSYGGVVAYRLDATGSVVFHTQVYDDHGTSQLHCNTIAMHVPTHSLYCGALDHLGIAILDVPSGAPRVVGQEPSKLIGYRNIIVLGDTLYAAGTVSGLDVFPIHPDGTLGDATHVLDSTKLERIDTDGTTLYGASSDLGLVAIGADYTLRTIATFDGPVVRMRMHDGMAAIALGSQGARLIDLNSGAIVSEQHPKCVVTSADFQQNTFAYGCYTGLFVYDLQKQRVFGWDRMRFGSMDVVFTGQRLITIDWWYIYYYTLDPKGFAADVDYPPGYVLKPGDGVQFAVRNPGDHPLHLANQVLPPYGEITLTVPPSTNPLEKINIGTEENPRPLSNVIIVRQGPYPALGAPFPIKGLNGKYTYFSAMTCALQFPAMQDMGWLSRKGLFPRGLTPIILDAEGTHVDDAMPDTWMQALEPMWSPLQFISLEQIYPGDTGLNTYNAFLDTFRFIDGGDNDNEYYIDENGVLVDYSRVYWGSFSPRSP